MSKLKQTNGLQHGAVRVASAYVRTYNMHEIVGHIVEIWIYESTTDVL